MCTGLIEKLLRRLQKGKQIVDDFMGEALLLSLLSSVCPFPIGCAHLVSAVTQSEAVLLHGDEHLLM